MYDEKMGKENEREEEGRKVGRWRVGERERGGGGWKGSPGCRDEREDGKKSCLVLSESRSMKRFDGESR